MRGGRRRTRGTRTGRTRGIDPFAVYKQSYAEIIASINQKKEKDEKK